MGFGFGLKGSNIGSWMNKGHTFLNQITGGAFEDITGRTDRRMAEEQYAASQAFAREQFEYSKMQDERNYQESLPSTKVQRMMEAGLHPTIAVGSGAHAAGSNVAMAGSHPQPQPRPHALDAMMKVASIASMIAGVGKIKAETDDIRKGTELKGNQISLIQEGIELSKLDKKVIERRLESGDLSLRHMNAVTEAIWESIETDIVRRNLTDAQTEQLMALGKLENERLAHNVEILKKLGLHEHTLTTEAASISSAIQNIMEKGIWNNKNEIERITRWFNQERQKYNQRMQNMLERFRQRREYYYGK